MKITRKKIRLLIKENLDEGIAESIKIMKIENLLKKEIKSGKLTSEHLLGLDDLEALSIELFDDSDDLVGKMSKKTGIALANYLNEKIKFEYKDGKVILTPPKKISIDGKTRHSI